MAKVYTGKVAIPGDKIDEYFALMKKSEEERAPFKQLLLSLCDDFSDAIEKKYVKKTVRKHAGIVKLFIDFLCDYTDVQDVSEITKGMVNSHFRKWWKRKVWDSTTENELRIALKKFFTFLAEEKSIVNMAVLNALK
jgi:site-specific recombinase XerD